MFKQVDLKTVNLNNRSYSSKKQNILILFSSSTSDDIFVTPLQDQHLAEQTPTSVSVTSSLHIEAMPIRSKMSPSQLNRSHSTSSLTHCSSVNSSTASSGRVKEGALRRSRSEARIVTASQTGSSTSGITNNTDGEASRLTVGVRVRPLHPRLVVKSIG